MTVPDLSQYKKGDKVSFQVLAGDQVLTDWEYTMDGSGPTPTDTPTATPTTGQPTQPGGTPTGGGKGSTGGKGTKNLPDTGADTRGILALGLILAGLGSAAVVARRKIDE